MNILNSNQLLKAAGILLICFSGMLSAETPEDYSGMSIEELMDVEITSASRKKQSLSETSLPVSVITAEEIHSGGFTNIPEILTFMPGVDVRRVDRYRYIVGVRGMTSHVSDRTLVLINGRNAMDVTYGAPDWMLLPILVEDIKRIEVLRGPGGAVWGANAFTGVINIITKKPGKELENLISTTVTEYGDTYNQLRLAGGKDKWLWRISAGYENTVDSDQAGAGRMESAYPSLNSTMGFDSYEARDFSRTSRFDTEFTYDYSDDTKFSFGAAYTESEAGDRELTGRYPERNVLSSYTRLFARVDHDFDEDSSGYLQWYGNYNVSHKPHLTARYAGYDNSIEGQYNTTAGDNHSITLGGLLRWTHLSSENSDTTGEIVFGEGSYDEYTAGFFAVDRWDITERLALETQARVDRYNKTSTDWSLRTTANYALDEEKNHTARLSFARSFRAAGVMVRDPSLVALGGLINLEPAKDRLRNESTYSLEAGYTGEFGNNLTVQVNSYYQRMDHILATVTETIGPASYSHFDNQDGADTYGAESEITYKTNNLRFSGWYAYNAFATDHSNQSIRAYFPARHKAGFRAKYLLDDKWTLNANYTYNDAVHINKSGNPAGGDLSMFHKLDLNISRKFADNQGEFMIGVSDVLNNTRDTVYDVSYFTSYQTPGRTFFARLQYKF